MEVRGATPAELGKATGVSRATISSARKNKRGISKANAVKLAAYFRVSPAAFLGVRQKRSAVH
jgi:plasmid maintenance system antidote protein VapI